jgi:hypothetical protein
MKALCRKSRRFGFPYACSAIRRPHGEPSIYEYVDSGGGGVPFAESANPYFPPSSYKRASDLGLGWSVRFADRSQVDQL